MSPYTNLQPRLQGVSFRQYSQCFRSVVEIGLELEFNALQHNWCQKQHILYAITYKKTFYILFSQNQVYAFCIKPDMFLKMCTKCLNY